MKLEFPRNYHHVVKSLKDKIRKARIRAARKLNADLLEVYWEIGKVILEQEKAEKWGAKIVENLSRER